MQTHYIFITGGVVSGLGKCITAYSIGKILQSKGFKVTAIKLSNPGIPVGTLSICFIENKMEFPI